jgi:hypothetical protein
VNRRYPSLPEYRPHPGCPHPVHYHTSTGCLAYNCRCVTTRRALGGRMPVWEAADWMVRIIGWLWLLEHVWQFLTWVAGGG